METSKIKLRYRDRDLMFKKEYSQLKIKVALNWFEIFALIIVAFFISLKVCAWLNIGNLPVNTVIASITSIGITFLFSCFRKYQLKITRFDKEHIYKKISNDLIEESKKQD